MYHRRIKKGAAGRALAAVALAGGALASGSTMLLATTGTAEAAESGTMMSVPVSYSCDFSSYQAGQAPLTVNSMINVPSTVMAGTPLNVTLVTSVTAIPAATAASLPAVNYLNLTGMAAVSGAMTMNDSLAGRSGYLGTAAKQMTEIPSLSSTGTVTPGAAGTLSVAAPSSLSLALTGTSGALAPVPCTAMSAVQVQVRVTVTASTTGTGTGTGKTGAMAALPAGTQAYACATPATAANGDMPTTSVVPMRLASVGPDSMTAANMVSLTSATAWNPMAGATPATASAALGLEGASGGSIPLAVGMHGGDLALTGTWQPTKTGLFRLTAPHRFQVMMRTTTTTTVTIMVVCTATTATTTTTTVKVAASAGGTADSEGIAPNTGAGGSLHSPVDLSLLAAGILAAAAGLVTMLLAIRRRGRAMMP